MSQTIKEKTDFVRLHQSNMTKNVDDFPYPHDFYNMLRGSCYPDKMVKGIRHLNTLIYSANKLRAFLRDEIREVTSTIISD